MPDITDMMIEASGTPVMLSFTDDHTRIAHLADRFDGVIVAGEHDMCLKSYDERLRTKTVETCPGRHRRSRISTRVYLLGKRFVWATQWHPKFSHKVGANQRAILAAFVNAAK